MAMRKAQPGEPDHARTVRPEDWPSKNGIRSFRRSTGAFCSAALELKASTSSDGDVLEPKFDGPPDAGEARNVVFFGLTPLVEAAVEDMFSMGEKEMVLKLWSLPDNLDDMVGVFAPGGKASRTP